MPILWRDDENANVPDDVPPTERLVAAAVVILSAALCGFGLLLWLAYLGWRAL